MTSRRQHCSVFTPHGFADVASLRWFFTDDDGCGGHSYPLFGSRPPADIPLYGGSIRSLSIMTWNRQPGWIQKRWLNP